MVQISTPVPRDRASPRPVEGTPCSATPETDVTEPPPPDNPARPGTGPGHPNPGWELRPAAASHRLPAPTAAAARPRAAASRHPCGCRPGSSQRASPPLPCARRTGGRGCTLPTIASPRLPTGRVFRPHCLQVEPQSRRRAWGGAPAPTFPYFSFRCCGTGRGPGARSGMAVGPRAFSGASRSEGENLKRGMGGICFLPFRTLTPSTQRSDP